MATSGTACLELDERERRAGRGRELVAALGQEQIDAVALTFVDNAGIVRVKTVPLAGLVQAAAWGVGMSPVFDAFLVDDSVAPGGRPDGDLRLLPDLDRLTRLAAQPGWAWAPVDRYTQDGEPYPVCQRLFARRMVDRAAEAGLQVRMGFEVEWAVGVEENDQFVPACAGPGYGMIRLVELSDYCRAVHVALAAESLPVLQVHPEYAAGQFEVSVGPTDPVAAADAAVLVRETIRAVSARHGLRATFAPVVVAGTVGNGGHVHLSVRRDGVNLFAGGDRSCGMTADGESFLAGLLAELPALVAIGAPSVPSYLRLVPSHWAGAYQCWGRENREAALRFVTGSAGEQDRAANAEVKCFDLSANPYLVAGAVLAAGLSTVDKGRRLPEEVTGDPAAEAGQVAGHGVTRLPQSVPEALGHLERSDTLRGALGERLYESFVDVRRAEVALFAGATPEAVVAATRWRY
ncbi:MAG TPA: glutamine synthetase family protein [Mycobacteriales bacterium]|nr:glutamine synthetase family protein [Mycobacteriales bacterium]